MGETSSAWLRLGKQFGRHGAALGAGLLRLALPCTCVGCGAITADDGGLCGRCWSELAFITPPFCARTGLPLPADSLGQGPLLSAEARATPPAYDRARAAVEFTDLARKLVHDLKYADRHDVARPMARLMALAGRELVADADLVVPVPLHPLRLWRRRFNQAALLARHLAPTGRLTIRADLLRRQRSTPSQTRLGRQARHANVAGAFSTCGDAASLLPGRRVLLVDDVCTTGATLDACARALRRAGAAHVDAVTFARVVDFA